MIGIDIVEIERMERALRIRSFLARVFTEAEREFLRAKNFSLESAAGMFACKEAVAKALGCGIAEGVRIADIEVLHNDKGAPYVNLYHSALAKLGENGAQGVAVSISHEKHYAVASAILTGVKS